MFAGPWAPAGPEGIDSDATQAIRRALGPGYGGHRKGIVTLGGATIALAGTPGKNPLQPQCTVPMEH